MAYLGLITQDSFYYELAAAENITDFKKSLNNPKWLEGISKIIALPTYEEIKENLNKKEVAFISPGTFKPEELIVFKSLPNREANGSKTTQQVLYDEDSNIALYDKFGIRISTPTKTFKDLKGFDIPKKEILATINNIQKGIVSGLACLSILIGVSRSGKSYLAEVIAGQLGRKLVILDLNAIMSSSNPAKMLDEAFAFLETLGGYVLLIDEIEKVVNPNFSSSLTMRMLGKLLTLLNDLNSDIGYQVGDNPIIATANNIVALLEKNPEFINRFGLKYFVNYSEKSTFIEVSDYYLSKFKVTGIKGEDLYNHSNTIYGRYEVTQVGALRSNVEYGKYANGEIKTFVNNLMMFCTTKEDKFFCDIATLKSALEVIKPQLVYANDGVVSTIEGAILASFREVS